MQEDRQVIPAHPEHYVRIAIYFQGAPWKKHKKPGQSKKIATHKFSELWKGNPHIKDIAHTSMIMHGGSM